MKTIYEKIEKLGKVKFFIAFILLYVLFNIFFFTTMTPVGKYFLKDIKLEHILDMKQKGYNSNEVKSALEALGDNGRNAYIRNLFTIDIVHPLLLSLLLISGIALFLRLINFKKTLLGLTLIFPVLYLIFDLLENILIAFLINQFPKVILFLVNTASLVTRLKWITLNIGFITSFILLFIMTIVIIIRMIKKKQ